LCVLHVEEDVMIHLETLRRGAVARGLIVAAAASMVTVLLSGCMTTDAYTGDKKVSKTTKGAGLGALAGAAVGALTGDNSKERRKRALIGAGVGALAGGAVGNYMDRQESKLRAQLQGTGVSVTRSGDNIILNMPGNITFATGSADLNANFFGVLDSVVLVLKEFDKTIIDVAGHTDSVGSDQTNQALSERRAGTVGTYLRGKGVQDNRVATVGYGKTHPVASNDTPDGRQQNRRVELTLTPLTT
jgi:outer membrane protein OmpA-like peptidoglycan-associated protein